MQVRLREEVDADRIDNYASIVNYRSGENLYEVYCGTCGKVFYTDHDNSARMGRTIGARLENPFICDECTDEYEELAYEEH